MIVKKFKTLVNHPEYILNYAVDYGLLNWMSDETFLKIKYRIMMGRQLNLDHPITYNEKLQWLKLHDRRPLYKVFADKYAVRQFLGEKIGEDYLVPLIGVYDTVNEIPWSELPGQFVLKCTHGTNANIICQDKNQLDIEKSKRQLTGWMKTDFFWHGREWQYKDMQPRIICEKFLVDESGDELKDYKIHCFDGEPRLIIVVSNRFSDTMNTEFYDLNWNRLPFYQHYPPSTNGIPLPANLEKMAEIARLVSQGFPYLRIDFYNVYGLIYVGEITLHPASGWLPFTPDSADRLVGSYIKLPNGKCSDQKLK